MDIAMDEYHFTIGSHPPYRHTYVHSWLNVGICACLWLRCNLGTAPLFSDGCILKYLTCNHMWTDLDVLLYLWQFLIAKVPWHTWACIRQHMYIRYIHTYLRYIQTPSIYRYTYTPTNIYKKNPKILVQCPYQPGYVVYNSANNTYTSNGQSTYLTSLALV